MADENDLHVEVNETNIAIYDLVQLTGNTKELLLQRAREAEHEGFTLTCRIPNPNDRLEVNAFEHFQSEPDPELGPVAEALSSGQALGTDGVRCRYELRYTDEVGEVWVCIIHGNNSKHDVTGPDSDVPCLTIDPYHTEAP